MTPSIISGLCLIFQTSLVSLCLQGTIEVLGTTRAGEAVLSEKNGRTLSRLNMFRTHPLLGQ